MHYKKIINVLINVIFNRKPLRYFEFSKQCTEKKLWIKFRDLKYFNIRKL